MTASYTEIVYVLYILISIALTAWVARTLHRNGRAFLLEAFQENETLADSVNHLLVVGFYLVNIGFVTMALKYGTKPRDLQGAIEFLSTKVGCVLLVLGAMHFINMAVFSRMRNRQLWQRTLEAPPVQPDQRRTPPSGDARTPMPC